MSLKQWKQTRRNGTPNRVGRFYMHLAQHIVGGHITKGDSSLADIIDWNGCIGYEVKASDDNHRIRIRWCQLESHASDRNAGFPLSSYMYCICSYGNREKKRAGGARKSLLGMCRDGAAARACLAENSRTLYVLDLRIIEAIARHLGVQKRLFPCDSETEGVAINHSFMRRFQTHPEEMLSLLGLKKDEWRHQSVPIQTSFEANGKSYPVSITVVEIKHAEMARELSLERYVLSKAA